MKRAMRWNDEDDDESSTSSSSTSSLSDGEAAEKKTKTKAMHRSKAHKPSKGESGKQKSGAMDFEALKRYGYRGGLSVLNVPAPKEEVKQDWSWSTCKERAGAREADEESYEERQKTRYAVMEGEQLANVQTRREKEKEKEKGLSFSQKEKRKRTLGQASRGKNYVEEEKRLLRDSGVYSGFDT